MEKQSPVTTKITMRQIPEGEGPYERCMEKGPGVLSDAELLAVIIRTGSRQDTSIELAQKILKMGEEEGVSCLLHLSFDEFTAVKGIGKVKAAQLMCIAELSKRIWRSAGTREAAVYQEPEQIAGYYMEALRHLEQEHIYAMFFDTRQHLIRDVLLSKGTVNSSVLSPRDLFIEALRARAVRFAIVHNHPSGDPSPSREDKLLTKRVKEFGAVLGIPLVDHVIIGGNSYMSFKERGML